MREKLMETACLFYGRPSRINNADTVIEAAKIYAQYDIVVWGDGYHKPTHPTYTDTVATAAKLKELRPDVKLFGYVPIGLDVSWDDSNLTMDDIKARIDEWGVVGATHIFLDEFGYDYSVTRERQNECIRYCRAKGMNVCANAWNQDHVFSNADIVLGWMEDFRGNPTRIPAIIGENDYVLFENTLYAYENVLDENGKKVAKQRVNNSRRILDMLDYTQKPREDFGGETYYDHYKTKGFALDAILKEDKRMYAEGYLVSLACKMGAYAASVASWGASDSNYVHYETPSVHAMNRSEIGKTEILSYKGMPNARFKTTIGSSKVDMIWSQLDEKKDFKPQVIGDGFTHIVSFSLADESVCLSKGTIELTFGDATDKSNVFYVPILKDDTGAVIRKKILNYTYSDAFKSKWTYREEGDKILFETRVPSTELGTQWWVYHKSSLLTIPATGLKLVQKGIGKVGGVDVRQVSLDGEIPHGHHGETWRRPHVVDDGFMYFDTTTGKPYWFSGDEWMDGAR